MNITDLPIDVYRIIYEKIDNIFVLNNLFTCNRLLRKSINNYYFLNHSINMISKICLNFYYKYMKYMIKYNTLRHRLGNLSSSQYHNSDSESSMDFDEYINYE